MKMVSWCTGGIRHQDQTKSILLQQESARKTRSPTKSFFSGRQGALLPLDVTSDFATWWFVIRDKAGNLYLSGQVAGSENKGIYLRQEDFPYKVIVEDRNFEVTLDEAVSDLMSPAEDFETWLRVEERRRTEEQDGGRATLHLITSDGDWGWHGGPTYKENLSPEYPLEPDECFVEASIPGIPARPREGQGAADQSSGGVEDCRGGVCPVFNN